MYVSTVLFPTFGFAQQLSAFWFRYTCFYFPTSLFLQNTACCVTPPPLSFWLWRFAVRFGNWRLQVYACHSFGWSCLILADFVRTLIVPGSFKDFVFSRICLNKCRKQLQSYLSQFQTSDPKSTIHPKQVIANSIGIGSLTDWVLDAPLPKKKRSEERRGTGLCLCPTFWIHTVQIVVCLVSLLLDSTHPVSTFLFSICTFLPFYSPLSILYSNFLLFDFDTHASTFLLFCFFTEYAMLRDTAAPQFLALAFRDPFPQVAFAGLCLPFLRLILFYLGGCCQNLDCSW